MKTRTGLQKSIDEHLRRKQADAAYAGTFECKYRDLLLWKMDEESKCDDILTPSGYLDGAHTEAIRRVRDEYKSRLSALKEKHHVEGGGAVWRQV